MAKWLLLDPEAVRRRLATRFRNNYRQWFTAAGQWPIAVPLGVPTEQQTRASLSAVQQWAETWRRWQGEGDLVWTERRWAEVGTQQLPERLLLHTPRQVVRWLGEEARWQSANARQQQLLQMWPQLAAKLAGHFIVLADYPETDFQCLIATLQWLTAHPESGLYIRQLPVPGVDSKWLASRKTLIVELLQAIRETPERDDFFTVTGIRRKPVLMRCRLLDTRLRCVVGGLGDITAPVAEIAVMTLRA